MINMDRELCCCFTGHRNIPSRELKAVENRVGEEILKMIDRGVATFINGAALGFDMLCAEKTIEIKKENPELADRIRLVLYLPCVDQNKNWSSMDKFRYNMMIVNADEHIFITKTPYTSDCMRKRNYKMVDDSAYCISYFTGKRSGTMQTINYAKKNSLFIVNIAESVRNFNDD